MTDVEFHPMSIAIAELSQKLNGAVMARRIGEGFEILGRSIEALEGIESSDEAAAQLVLCIAEWVDAGYSDHRLIESLLRKFPADQRRQMPISEYLLLRMAEAFSCIAKEDADSAIALLQFVLQAEREL
ncbi:MAG TPA: hypothetical protein VM912_09475, partial [Terriglobales bacterium]|nr:hypothetical protein [Terriglobales bacterium]